MNNVTRTGVLTLSAAVPAFLLSRALFPPAPGTPEPTANQLPWFVLLAVLEALVFGLGVAFLVMAVPAIRRAQRRLGVPLWPVYLAVGWSLVSWWPHDRLHRSTGFSNLNALLGIEFAFHVSLYVAGLVVAWFFIRVVRGPGAGRGG